MWKEIGCELILGSYYINRKTKKTEKEKVPGYTFIKWIYNTRSGKITNFTLLRGKFISKFYGHIQDFFFSRFKIKKFVKEQNINLKEAEKSNIKDYKNFNDFFTRKLKPHARKINYNEDVLISPADGKLLAYENIDTDNVVQVKGLNYSLGELIGDDVLAKDYNGGSKIIVRLAPQDYHRFHFPDDGLINEIKSLKGKYYSVNPIALDNIVKLYCQNKRIITKFKSKNFGKVLMVEVGATFVGSIIQTYNHEYVKKGEEKGYFKFGGSTVILFFKKDILKVDSDLIKNTRAGYETKVLMGEKIARKYNK